MVFVMENIFHTIDQSATTDLPLATSYSSYFSPVPSLYMTSIKTTAGPELGYTSETSPLLQTSTKTSYTASPHLSMKTVSRLSTITLQSGPQPSSASVASTESTLTRGVPNKAATIGIAFGVVSGLLVLVVLIIVVLAVVLLIIVGRKQKKLSQSFKRYTTHGMIIMLDTT